jgi:hypothetical protein
MASNEIHDTAMAEESPRVLDEKTGQTSVNDLEKYDSDDEKISPNAQAGVQAIEATTSVWSRRDLILAYVL